MLNGQPPFPGGGLIEKLQRHTATPFPAITAAGIPANFERLLAYLVNKDPARRYVHAGDIPDKIQLLLPGVNLQIPPIAVPESEASYFAAVAQQKQAAGSAERENPTHRGSCPGISTNSGQTGRGRGRSRWKRRRGGTTLKETKTSSRGKVARLLGCDRYCRTGGHPAAGIQPAIGQRKRSG
jgi:hypothetical protein